MPHRRKALETWVAAVGELLAADGIELVPEGTRWRVLEGGLPTDLRVGQHKLLVTYTLRTRHAHTRDGIVLPAENSFECAFSTSGGLLEPQIPGAALDQAAPATAAFLTWLENRGFSPEYHRLQSLLVRDRFSHALVEEWHAHEPSCPLGPAAEAAARIRETLAALAAATHP